MTHKTPCASARLSGRAANRFPHRELREVDHACRLCDAGGVGTFWQGLMDPCRAKVSIGRSGPPIERGDMATATAHCGIVIVARGG